ncbi:MAG: tetratricopeptide repeat protein [Candidatus Pacebacteria bacterium]|nr:tetratricopeptide repeat protein [Candidatus Paceibacterota bacterium]
MQKTLSRKITVSLLVLAIFGFFYFFRETSFQGYISNASNAKRAGDEGVALENLIFASSLDEQGRDAEIVIKRAELLYGRGDYTAAEQELARPLESGRGTSALNGWMGRVKYAQGDYSSAEKYFSQAFKMDPTAKSAVERAGNLVRGGKFTEAETALQTAQQRISSEDVVYYLGLVRLDEGKYSTEDFASIRNGKYASEIAIIEEYIFHAGDDVRADSDYGLVKSAELFRKLGEEEFAFANLDIVLSRSNKYRDAYLVSGKTFAAAHDYVSAKEAFEKCLELDVDNIEAVFYLGKLYEAAGDREKAEEFAIRYEKLVK